MDNQKKENQIKSTLTRRKLMGQMALLGLTTLPISAGARDRFCRLTRSQGEGPFRPTPHQRQVTPDQDQNLAQIQGASKAATGQLIYVHGVLLSRKCIPLSQYKIEIWQANHFGRYLHPGDNSDLPEDPYFQGWGKTLTDSKGEFIFRTILPGEYGIGGPGSSIRPRHIHFKVFNPQNKEVLTTQMYFDRKHPLTLNDQSKERVPSSLRRRIAQPPLEWPVEESALYVNFPMTI